MLFRSDDTILPTVNGRMSSSIFDFYILNSKNKSKIKVDVTNSQLEIDGGFEGAHSLVLLEAKNSLSDDFLVRQLYYPFRLWRSLVSKDVKPVFMTYSNSIFSLYEYNFKDPDDYNSLELIKHKNYSFEATSISMEEILNVLKHVVIVAEPQVPFPQANNFKRVINLCELLNLNDLSLDDITAEYSFDGRQSQYYSAAGMYLGLIEKHKKDKKIFLRLTALGKSLLKMKYKERQLKLVELILSHEAFNKTFRATIDESEIPDKDGIVRIMKDAALYKVKEEKTYVRRSSTIMAWVNWILDLINE